MHGIDETMVLGSKQSKLPLGKNAREPKAPASLAAAAGAAHRKGLPLSYVAAAVIIIIIIIAGAYLFLAGSSSSAYSLTTNRTLSMTVNQTILIQESGQAQPTAVELTSHSGSSYTFLITKVPVLSNPVYTFTLTQGEIINVSDTGSSNADMQIKLVSSSGTGAMVEFISIPATFGVKAAYLATVGVQQSTTPTTAATTTIQATTTATSGATTSTPTTSVSSSGGTYTAAEVVAVANSTGYGIIMNDLNVLYTKDASCTAGQYNTTYYDELHSNATVPNDYYNESKTTPYEIASQVSFVSGTVYYVNYSTASHSSITTGPALSLELNAQTSQVISAKFEGNIFGGETLTDVNSTYETQEGISGDCGALLP